MGRVRFGVRLNEINTAANVLENHEICGVLNTTGQAVTSGLVGSA